MKTILILLVIMNTNTGGIPNPVALTSIEFSTPQACDLAKASVPLEFKNNEGIITRAFCTPKV